VRSLRQITSQALACRAPAFTASVISDRMNRRVCEGSGLGEGSVFTVELDLKFLDAIVSGHIRDVGLGLMRVRC
jgi:hypothetical protein